MKKTSCEPAIPQNQSNSYSYESLVELIRKLRGKNGCPWDRKQTPLSMVGYALEEIHELIAAIESKDPQHVCEELGDTLFQLAFIGELFEENGDFTLADVIGMITTKMIRRHPHVFGDVSISSPDEVKAQWREIKKTEKKNADFQVAANSRIDPGMPALMRAQRAMETHGPANRDTSAILKTIQTIVSQMNDFAHRISAGKEQPGSMPESDDEMERKFGDMLLAMVQMARLLDIQAEAALSAATERYFRQQRVQQTG